jgi:uncharacterized protein involved in outer membrane biogenesis
MRWKWIVGIIGLVVVALIVICYVVMVTYDFNKLKPKMAQAALEATGRELTLGGDFKVSLGFSPSISVTDVNLQNAPWGSRPEMAKVKRLEVQIALLPLIRREVQFKRLILVGPDILVETDRSERSNLEFKPGAKPKPEGEERKGLTFLVFEELRIEKGVVTYRDGKQGKTYFINIDDLTAFLPRGEKATDFSLKGTFNGQPLEIQGTTGPIGALIIPERPWPIKVTVKVGGSTITFEGSLRDVLKGKGLDLKFNADGPSIRKVVEVGGVTNGPDLGPFRYVEFSSGRD